LCARCRHGRSEERGAARSRAFEYSALRRALQMSQAADACNWRHDITPRRSTLRYVQTRLPSRLKDDAQGARATDALLEVREEGRRISVRRLWSASLHALMCKPSRAGCLKTVYFRGRVTAALSCFCATRWHASIAMLSVRVKPRASASACFLFPCASSSYTRAVSPSTPSSSSMRAPRNNSKSKGSEESGSGAVTLVSVLTKAFYPRERQNLFRNHDRGG